MSLQTTFHHDTHKIHVLAGDRLDPHPKKDIRAGSDAFSQVFSDMQKSDKLFAAPEVKKNEARWIEPKAPLERKDCASKMTRKDVCHEARDDRDDDRVSATDDDRGAQKADRSDNMEDKKVDGPDKTETKTENDKAPVEAKKDEPKVKPEGDTDKPQAKTEIQDVVSVIETAGEDGANTTSTETKTQAAALTPQAGLAHEAKTTTPQTATPQGEGQHKAEGNGEEAQLKTISFRASVAAGHDPAGKRDAVVEQPVAGDANADISIDAGAKVAVDDKPKENSGEKTADTASQFKKFVAEATAQVKETAEKAGPRAQDAPTAVREVKDSTQEKKEPRLAAATEASAPAAQDISHPAAGTRVTAQLGVPAPSSNGLPGGGSPLPATAKGDNAALIMNAVAVDGVRAGQGDHPLATLVRNARDGMPGNALNPGEQVAVQMHRMAKSGTERFELQLHPADLGRVDIRMDINKDGLVRVIVTADNQAAFEMLQKDSRGLERALQQAGLQTDSNSLNFNLRGGENGHAGAGKREDGSGKGSAPGGAALTAANDDTAIAASYHVAPGRVDVRI
jgi:flagellar hook-length control protein FliK